MAMELDASKIYREYKEVLKDLLRFKSVSTDSAYKDELAKTVDYLTKYITHFAEKVRVLQGASSNPVIYAYIKADNNNGAKTVLVYGHYDVQPAPSDGWFRDPFELYEANGRLYGRGVVDNKGQFLVHLLIIKLLKEQKRLAHNVVLILEGDEETGNDELIDLVKLKVDEPFNYIVVSDGQLVLDYPTIEYSLRGGFNMEVRLTTASKTVHSGLYGGFLPNAAVELTKLLSRLLEHNVVEQKSIKNKLRLVLDRFVNFKSIFRAKIDYTRDRSFVRKNAKGAKLVISQTLDELGAKAYHADYDNEVGALDMFTQTGLTPTIEITGISSGYTDKGFSNIIPHQATAKLNVRTAPGQSAEKISKELERRIVELAPKWANLQINVYHVHEATIFQLPKNIEKRLVATLQDVYGQDVVWRPVGGAIPFVTEIYNYTKITPLMIPFANQDCNMHGVNENFRVDLVQKALKFSYRLWQGEILR